MAKIQIDIERIKKALEDIGYVINEVIERDNNGKNWQIKFSNSGAIATVYDSNKKSNTVVNGKCEPGEQPFLKSYIDGIKCGEIDSDPLNPFIIDLIHSKKEDYYYDFKQAPYDERKKYDLLHDVLCLINNIEHREAYLIIGVTNDYSVIGVDEQIESNNLINWLTHLDFAGNLIPDVEIKHLHYHYISIEVIICKPTKKVPFYLEKREGKVEAYHIYTRVGDTNTPVNENASYNDVCKLWQYHFSE